MEGCTHFRANELLDYEKVFPCSGMETGFLGETDRDRVGLWKESCKSLMSLTRKGKAYLDKTMQ